MSLPTIPDMNPEIDIDRDDAINIIITSIAMEELALSHILNAEGEKLQYVLGTLKDKDSGVAKDPGEITICDIMAVNNSIQKTLKDVIKEEMLLQLKLEDAIEFGKNGDACPLTIKGQKIWRDGNNRLGTRPPTVEISLLRDGKVYDSVTLDSTGDGKYTFACLPVCNESGTKYTYQIDEIDVPDGYKKTISGFNVINTAEPGQTTINGTKIWVDNNDTPKARPTKITVNLLQNGVQFLPKEVDSPVAPNNNVNFSFLNVPQFDDNGSPFVYTVDEADVANYRKKIDGLTITNTHVSIP